MMTLKQILSSTLKDRKESSNHVAIVEAVTRSRPVKNVNNGEKGTAQLRTVYAKIYDRETATSMGRRRIHKLYIRAVDGPSYKVSKGNHVLVRCNCEDFMFTWEYALAKKGAALIHFCDGEAPDEKNPLLIPGVCKHLYRVGLSLILKGM